MSPNPLTDWDDAYSNSAYIAGGGAFPAKWQSLATSFRDELASAGRFRADNPYDPHPRNRFDLFLPEGEPRGLAIFVHGGYWMAFDKSCWSHLARGSLARGYAVAMPSYVLCPEARISDIVGQIADAIAAAAGEIAGPIHLAGHSAGGHLVSRVVCSPSPLRPDLIARIRKIVSIAGLHDLRPLMNTRMNDTLRLDIAEARAESPALLEPLEGIDLTCWVGAAERPEFLRQNGLPENLWSSFDARVASVVEPGRHHFDVIDGLMDADHPLVRTLMAV
ncbi:MAG: alpha/beta fold hydrolase [Pseudaminobacter sp.]|nr:alpha/beta fold hydrolase [Pseudaminobacter sp.]